MINLLLPSTIDHYIEIADHFDSQKSKELAKSMRIVQKFMFANGILLIFSFTNEVLKYKEKEFSSSAFEVLILGLFFISELSLLNSIYHLYVLQIAKDTYLNPSIKPGLKQMIKKNY